jgi:hypothetical protein
LVLQWPGQRAGLLRATLEKLQSKSHARLDAARSPRRSRRPMTCSDGAARVHGPACTQPRIRSRFMRSGATPASSPLYGPASGSSVPREPATLGAVGRGPSRAASPGQGRMGPSRMPLCAAACRAVQSHSRSSLFPMTSRTACGAEGRTFAGQQSCPSAWRASLARESCRARHKTFLKVPETHRAL